MRIASTAERLKELMNDRNLRQIDILNAAKPYCEKYSVKLGRNDLSQYVSGKVEPGPKKISILSLSLNVNEAWLMGYDVSFSECMTTGQRIKARRKQLGISAEKLADKLDISPATIYRYENGDIEKVPGERLAQIAETLSVTPAFLLGLENEHSTVKQIPCSINSNPFSEDSIREQYLVAIRKMSVEDQYRWLVRIQDYIAQNYPTKEE